MTRAGAVPPALRAALASPGGTCYRHCDGAIRTVVLASPFPGRWSVRACPAGVVSVTSYTEWTRRDPTPRVQGLLRRWTRPASLVRRFDLRLATRHGPELGPVAERRLAASRPARGLRTVYWRVYPFRGRDGLERRLFLCRRRAHRGPVFYAARVDLSAVCPVCGGRSPAPPKRRGRGPRVRRR